MTVQKRIGEGSLTASEPESQKTLASTAGNHPLSQKRRSAIGGSDEFTRELMRWSVKELIAGGRVNTSRKKKIKISPSRAGSCASSKLRVCGGGIRLPAKKNRER